MIDKILVGTEAVASSAAEPVIDAAADLASALGAELVVLSTTSTVDIDKVLDREDRPASGHHVRRVRRRCPDVRARSMDVAGEWPGAILDAAREENPDLIIVPKLAETESVTLVGTVHGNGGHARRLGPASGRRLERALQGLRSFYGRPVGWMTLLVTSVFLTYGGGALMFWLHAIVRGERGPAINHWYHWVLDSSLGFVALTPALFFILPAALWALGRTDHTRRRLALLPYVASVGALFALVTSPGPLLHNTIAGEGTAVAGLAERVFGHNTVVAERSMHAIERSPLTEGLLQVGIGMPVYMAMSGLAVWSARFVRRRQHTPNKERKQDHDH